MSSTKKTMLAVLACLLLWATASWGNPPNVTFTPGGVGLNVPLQTDMQISSYGRTQFVGGLWELDGNATRTTGSSFSRYETSVEGQSTMTAMPIGQDWLVVIEYKHTGAYNNTNQPWFLKHFEDDIRMVSLWNDGGGDNWSLRIGDATGTGWNTLVSGITLDIYWNTFKIHYKATTQTLDAYLNNTLIAGDFTFGHGRYDVNHIQLESIGAGTDWFSLAQIGGAVANTRSLTFGHEWVRSHPINIQGLVQRTGAVADAKYRLLNFTDVLCWKNRPGIMDNAREKQGLPWHYHTGKNLLDATLIATLNDHIQNRPGGQGMLVWDEPTRPDLLNVFDVTDWVKSNYPELLVYGNMSVNERPWLSNYGQTYGTTLLPDGSYEDPPVPYDYDIIMDDYMHFVRPDVLQFDAYPFTDGSDEVTDQYLRLRSYYRGLELVRAAGLRANVPYWIFIQSFDGGGTYLPSESDLRMQVFSSLAYGFSGLSYFVFGPWGNYGTTDGGLLTWADATETSYVETALYNPAAVVNLEIQNLGRTLKFLKSTQVRYRVGRYIDPATQQSALAPLPLDSIAWNAATDDPYITDIVVSNPGSLNDGLEADVLIGHFVPAVEDMDGPAYENEIYFMIVNLLRGQNTLADQASQDLTLNFDFQQSGISSLQKLNRETGIIEPVTLIYDGGSLYHLNLNVRGGSGELFKYNTGAPFVIGPDPAPKVTFTALAPGLNAPAEINDSVDIYGKNEGVAGVIYSSFSGTILAGGFTRYSTTLANDNTQVTPMPTDKDWVFQITYAATGNNFNDSAFTAKAKEGTPQEARIVNLVNNGAGVWSLKNDNTIVATNLPFDDEAFHTLVVHYKANTQTLDAYVDDALVASNFTASHGDYAVEYIQVSGYAAGGTLCSYHGIKIGQLDIAAGVCGDAFHPILLSDMNMDCLVNMEDLALFVANWNICTAPECD